MVIQGGNMKKIKRLLLILTILGMLPLGVFAKEKVNAYLFKREGCQYCANARAFFEELATDAEYKEYFNFVIKDVSSSENNSLMEATAKKFGVTLRGVPFIVIGEKYFEGYDSSFNDDIKSAIKTAYENETVDMVTSDKQKDSTSATTIIILLTFVSGIVFFIYMAKDTTTTVKPEKKVETKIAEPKAITKKTVIKKSTAKKSGKPKTKSKTKKK